MPKAAPVDVLFAGKTVLSNVAYGYAGDAVLSGSGLNAFSIGPFKTIDVATGDLVVQTTSNGESIDSKRQGKGLNLKEGKIYTAFISGEVNNSPSITVMQHN